MYPDTLLFIVSAICAFLALMAGGYLIVSRKRGKVYRDVLRQETEFYDAFTTTSLLTQKRDPSSVDVNKTESLSSYDKTASSIDANLTSAIFDNDHTEGLNQKTTEVIDFDASALEGRYLLRREIHGGGMSRVFLADSTKLGNQWIVKFISNQSGELANEENILKLLNHISLPKIVDIFRDDKGVYLVESYIEGVSLDKVLESNQRINQFVIMDWAEQLAQVLNYLHKMEPHPIHHLDLKPSNIMVTYDNRLVLIDFGISKRFGEDTAGVIGVTYRYAAPEQLKHNIAPQYMSLLKSRLGEIPPARLSWNPDARTDIYSLGVILGELALGEMPTLENNNSLRGIVSQELFAIINKCLALEPKERYQSAAELLQDLQKVKGSKVRMARTLFARKLAAVAAIAAFITCGGSFTGGYYVYAQESAATLGVNPDIVTVSLQQSTTLAVEKIMPEGDIVLLDNTQIRWAYSEDNIARVDGNRISGLNLGESDLSGSYRNKSISVNVRVVEPMDGMVNISQRYQLGHRVEVFAGNNKREHDDGALAEAEFVSPESIAIAGDGTIYVTDAGLLRRISGDYVDSVNFEPDFLTPRIVRCYNNDVYILTDEWEDGDGIYYGIIKLTEAGAEGLYMADAQYTAVEDFILSSEGLIYFIDRNAGVNGVFLKTINPADIEDIQTLTELPAGTCALAEGEDGVLYLANPKTGAIQIWQDGVLSYFAGIENEKAFVDGNAPLFYMPQKLKYAKGFLYVWDFNVVRRISIVGGIATECITLAGEASPTFDLDIVQTSQAAEDIILPNSKLMDFAVGGEGELLLTDPKRGVLWRLG